jgi:Ribosomal RNA-processing protein 7 (RRP7) C-terminal domain
MQARFPGNQVLQQELDEWVVDHEAAAVRKRKAAEAAAEDGWTVVKRSRVHCSWHAAVHATCSCFKTFAAALQQLVGDEPGSVRGGDMAAALHQGRHKTTDEEGTAVGGVAAAAAADIGARAKPQVTQLCSSSTFELPEPWATEYMSTLCRGVCWRSDAVCAGILANKQKWKP